MFDILQENEKELIIYKSVMVDAANCVLRSTDKYISDTAKASLQKMISKMDFYFEKHNLVRMNFLKNKNSDSIVFTSINMFKIWLIRHQFTDSLMFVLRMVKDYYIKKGCPLPNINIVFGDYSFDDNVKYIYNTEMYFRNTYVSSEGWLDDDLIKKAIKSVDKSEVINGETIYSPIFGNMPPSKLSGGVKTLILISNNPDMIFNASTCGDNCVKWIEKLAKQKDFVISLHHTMHFSEKNFRAYILNDDAVVDNYIDYIISSDKNCRDAK